MVKCVACHRKVAEDKTIVVRNRTFCLICYYYFYEEKRITQVDGIPITEEEWFDEVETRLKAFGVILSDDRNESMFKRNNDISDDSKKDKD